MSNSQDLQMLFTGGADGKVLIWNKELKVQKEININSCGVISHNPKIRAIDFDAQSNQLVIGTRGSEIILTDLNQNKSKMVL